jgi:glycosyltransferase involved in cell wall biosynthesis
MLTAGRAGTVSVVTATYKGGAYVGDALASVFAQTRPVQEVIIVDDASPDDTADVVRALIRDAPVPVTLVVLPVNSGGPARPQNVGVRAARGDYLVILDQDDVLLPSHCERLVGALEATPAATLAFGPCGRLDAPDLPGAACQPPEVLQALRQQGRSHDGQVHLDGTLLAAYLVAQANFVVGFPGFAFRRADWVKMGGFDEGLRIAADYDTLLWLALHGEAILLPDKVYLRRSHASNASSARLPSAMELGRIIARTLHQYPILARQPIFVGTFRHHFNGLLASLEDANQYASLTQLLGDACVPTFQLILGAARLWGWNHFLGPTAWKLLRGWIRRPIRSPVGRQQRMQLREFVASLRDILRHCQREARSPTPLPVFARSVSGIQ